MSNEKDNRDLRLPDLDRYSLEDAAIYLQSKTKDCKYYSVGTVESLIEDSYLIVCVRDESRSGRWVYLNADAYHEFKVKGWPSMVSTSIEDARFGEYTFFASSKEQRFGSEIRVPRSELDCYLANPREARVSRAFRIRSEILELEKGTKKVAVPRVVEYILKELKHYNPEIEIKNLRGNVDNFHEFCGQLSNVIKSIQSKDMFNEYCKQKVTTKSPLCGWRSKPISDKQFWESIITHWEEAI